MRWVTSMNLSSLIGRLKQKLSDSCQKDVKNLPKKKETNQTSSPFDFSPSEKTQTQVTSC